MNNYTKKDNEIIVHNLKDFNVKQTLECGQIFRFFIEENVAKVYSKDKYALIKTYENKIVISSKDVDYFEDFFDLKTDYSSIKNQLKKDKFLTEAVEYGYGIRILKNDLFEMIVSFIISANNNISRIKKSIEFLCCNFGENKGDYFAFPTLKQLKKATVEDYIKAGLGYRSKQLFETIQNLNENQLENLKKQTRDDQLKFLISLKGVGEKVANCIMLFGLGVKDVFPVDTWINKVYNFVNKTQEKDRKRITKEMTEKYGEMSGYAQQYFFYYFRENKLNR